MRRGALAAYAERLQRCCSRSRRRLRARRRTSEMLANLPEAKDATAINFMSYGKQTA